MKHGHKEHHSRTLCLRSLNNPDETASTKNVTLSGHGFHWDCAHVLQHVDSSHKRIFLDSLHISLKTTTTNDKTANVPAIHHNVLKHE